MSFQKWEIGYLSNPNTKREIINAYDGRPYDTRHFNGRSGITLSIMMKLKPMDNATRKAVMAECFKMLVESEAVKPGFAINLPNLETVSVKEAEKYGLFGSKMRTVTKRIPNPDFKPVTDILAGEACIFLHSDREEEETSSYDEERDSALYLTETGRFILIDNNFTYHLDPPAPPNGTIHSVYELTQDSERLAIAAEMFAEKLGEEKFDEACKKAYAEMRKAKKSAPKAPGFNDPCPCGSGKRYKYCCGAEKYNKAKQK